MSGSMLTLLLTLKRVPKPTWFEELRKDNSMVVSSHCVEPVRKLTTFDLLLNTSWTGGLLKKSFKAVMFMFLLFSKNMNSK